MNQSLSAAIEWAQSEHNPSYRIDCHDHALTLAQGVLRAHAEIKRLGDELVTACETQLRIDHKYWSEKLAAQALELEEAKKEAVKDCAACSGTGEQGPGAGAGSCSSCEGRGYFWPMAEYYQAVDRAEKAEAENETLRSSYNREVNVRGIVEAELAQAHSKIERLKAEQGYDRTASIEAKSVFLRKALNQIKAIANGTHDTPLFAIAEMADEALSATEDKPDGR